MVMGWVLQLMQQHWSLLSFAALPGLCDDLFQFKCCWTAAAALLLIVDGQKQKLSAADESFKQSDTLKALLEKSEANRAKNKRDIQNK
jgi:hypothetical protein